VLVGAPFAMDTVFQIEFRFCLGGEDVASRIVGGAAKRLLHLYQSIVLTQRDQSLKSGLNVTVSKGESISPVSLLLGIDIYLPCPLRFFRCMHPRL